MRLGAITDEFSPDLDIAAPAMRAAGLETAELRVLWGKNILDASDEDVDRAITILRRQGLVVDCIASPLLKCGLPGGPELDERFQQDVFASKHSFSDQPRLAERAMAVAEKTGAKLIRVFSFWRTIHPDAVFEKVVVALRELATRAAKYGLTIGLENEHACNISTARETARVLAALDHPNLRVVWDPANALVAGETLPLEEAMQLIPMNRIAHVHAKDHDGSGWTALGDGKVGWAEQIGALAAGGYAGDVNLETHWSGPHGDKMEASQICARNLRQIAAST